MCGSAVASGSAAAFDDPGLTIAALADDAANTLSARATDAAGNVSACSAPFPYTTDSTVPDAPDLSSTSPSPPSGDANPTVSGSAEPGATIQLFLTAACTGAPASTGTAAGNGSFGILTPVAANATSQIRAVQIDTAGNPSACSAPLAYLHDSNDPAAPSLTSTDPVSPSNSDTTPIINGSGEAGGQLLLYATGNCSGAAGRR